MTSKKTNKNSVALHINGSLMGVSPSAKMKTLDRALRGVALSDSPVLLSGNEDICSDLLEKLHRLGRRAKLPMHNCHSPQEAENLFRAVLDEEQGPDEDTLGTWALFRVESWPRELQLNLNKILQALDESRLHGRLRHDRIPRVVVVQDPDADGASLDPDLYKRLSYFELCASEATAAEIAG